MYSSCVMIIGTRKAARILALARSSFWPYKYQIAVLVVLSFLGGVLEVVGVNAIIPIFSVIQGGETSDVLSRATKGLFSYAGLPFTVKYLMSFMALMFISKAIFFFISKQINIKIAADYEENTRSELFQAMVKSSWPRLSKQKVGYLDQILTTDVSIGSALLVHVGGAALITTNLIVYTLLALNVSFAIAVSALVLGASVLFIFKPLFYKNRMASEEMTQKYKDLAHDTNEVISGMKVIKSSNRENQVLNRARQYFSLMRALYTRVWFLRNITEASSQPLAAFFILGILAVFYKTSTLSFASFGVIIYAINRIFSNVQASQKEIHILSSAAPHVQSILVYKEQALRNEEGGGGAAPFKFDSLLEFKNVSFSYDGGARALSDISLSINHASLTGIIGPSGSGKSTLVDLLLRLQNPQKGSILIDGEDASQINLRDWRDNIAYVSQEVFLINDTINANIRFYNEELNEKDIVEASKIANIYDFIKSLPEGFETVVGERGLRLSGGERQRIVLARALLRRPQILILDEATSALDNESEALIQKAIEGLKGRTTIIVIAHRLSTVANSDKLIVLEEGRIRETGTPQELLKDQQSYFFRTYNLRK